MAQLREYYRKEVIPALLQQFGFDNTMRVPKITKVVLNMGLGEALADKKILENAAGDLEMISGQKVVITKARKSIAGFKIREGWPVGCKVTLRGERMYEFLERLVDIAIPRIRDFRGLSPKSFDGRGNFAMGVNEQIIFPEIEYDKIDMLRGLDITITTTARTDDEGRALLTALRFPFRGMPTAVDEKPAKRKAAPAKAAAEEVEVTTVEATKEENVEEKVDSSADAQGAAPAAEDDAQAVQAAEEATAPEETKES